MGDRKEFRDIQTQYYILQNKGLSFQNPESAKQLLIRYGYYEIINGYGFPFCYKDENGNEYYQKGTTFEQIYALYSADKEIRNAIFHGMIEVETNLRSIVSYVVSENFGVEQAQYMNRKNYNQGKPLSKPQRGYKIDTIIDKMKKISTDNVQPMKHYRQKYDNLYPWIMLKGFTFGNLVNFIKLQKSAPKRQIAALFFDVPVELVDDNLLNMFIDMLFLFHAYRNRSAHGGRIFNYHSEKATMRYSKAFHNRMNVNPADYRNGKGKTGLTVLLHALSWLDNKVVFIETFSNIEHAFQEYAKLYPELNHEIFSDLGIDDEFFKEIRKMMNSYS